MKKIIFGILVCTVTMSSMAQSFRETLVKEGRFEKKSDANAVIIANINGDVTVEGWAGDYVKVEVAKTITAKTQTRLEQGKTDVQIGVIDRADTLIYYVTGICHTFGRSTREKKWGNSPWSYQWDDKRNESCEPPFDYQMNFVVKVPLGVHVVVSTVNDGDIVVKNTKGKVMAHNINGSITLNHLERESVASTINGDVDVDFDKNPTQDCRFYTLNGDINALFQKGLAANMSFESFNGDLYTNVDELQSLPVQIEKESSKNGTKYKVNSSRYKIGKGGALLDFETFNGNAYLKEVKN